MCPARARTRNQYQPDPRHRAGPRLAHRLTRNLWVAGIRPRAFQILIITERPAGGRVLSRPGDDLCKQGCRRPQGVMPIMPRNRTASGTDFAGPRWTGPRPCCLDWVSRSRAVVLGRRSGKDHLETVPRGDMRRSWNGLLVPRPTSAILRTHQIPVLSCRYVERPWGIEPQTYALREARSAAARAWPASTPRVGATNAHMALGFSRVAVHVPVHAEPSTKGSRRDNT